MTPRKNIRFALETIDDMRFNESVHGFFSFVEELISQGFEVSFYRFNQKEPVTVIKDLDHLKNFKKSVGLPK